MSIIVEGRIGALALFALFNGIILYFSYQASSGRKYVLKRTLPALDFIPEAVGRAVEMDRPVHYTPGGTGLTGSRGTHAQMGFIIMGHVARVCARLGGRIICSIWQAAQLPLAVEIIRGAYEAEGVQLDEPDVRFYAEDDAPFAAGVIGTFLEEECAVNMIIGGAGSDFIVIAESANQLGLQQIGGSANSWLLPYVVASCDYTLIGEELFAAGAILAEDHYQLGGIYAIDVNKMVMIGLLVLGTILSIANISVIQDILLT